MDLKTFLNTACAFAQVDRSPHTDRPAVIRTLKGVQTMCGAERCGMALGHIRAAWTAEGTVVHVGTVWFVRPAGRDEWLAKVTIDGGRMTGDLGDVQSYTTDFRVMTGCVPRLASLTIELPQKLTRHTPPLSQLTIEAKRRLALVMAV